LGKQVKVLQKRNYPSVQNPTDLLTGLAEGAQVMEPVKQELRKATVARVRKKALRTKDQNNLAEQ
jgi:hypothetical protein